MKLSELRPDFEAYLIMKHANQYTGTDDCMPDDCSEWIGDLDVDTLISYANQYSENYAQMYNQDFLRQFAEESGKHFT